MLGQVGMTAEEFAEFCEWLKANAEIFDDDTDGLYPFLEAVTASEDYENFLRAMFQEVQRQQGVAPQEIDVAVPDGMGAGEVLAVDYLGQRYETVIPDGCGPGMTFRFAIA